MKAIVFDFFGVICSEITPFVLPRYMSKEAAIEYKASVVEEADLGHIELADVLEHLSKRTGASSATLEAEFWACVAINPEMVALIESLRPHYKTALLSNAMTPFLRQILKKHDLERLFDVLLVSAEEGMVKPDPKFFGLMIGKLGVPASECFFTDDNPINVAAARAAGMTSEQFVDVAKLKADLAALA